MGTSLCLSLVNKVVVAKSPKHHLAAPELATIINTGLPLDLSLFDFSEDENGWQWVIKPAMLQSGLLPLLTQFYPSFYRHSEAIADYQNLLDQLHADADLNAWLERARRKEKFCFQYDTYASPDYLRYPSSQFGEPLVVDFESIILAITGNIYLESYGGFLRYFGESVQMRFADFPLARCLKVYISG
jgi:hypothetical protein